MSARMVVTGRLLVVGCAGCKHNIHGTLGIPVISSYTMINLNISYYLLFICCIKNYHHIQPTWEHKMVNFASNPGVSKICERHQDFKVCLESITKARLVPRLKHLEVGEVFHRHQWVGEACVYKQH